jgi:hypothetical protein
MQQFEERFQQFRKLENIIKILLYPDTIAFET